MIRKIRPPCRSFGNSGGTARSVPYDLQTCLRAASSKIMFRHIIEFGKSYFNFIYFTNLLIINFAYVAN